MPINVETHPSQKLTGMQADPLVRYEGQRCSQARKAAQEQVFRNREVGKDSQFLLNESDTQCIGLSTVARQVFFAVEQNPSCVSFEDPRKDIHASGFAGAVFAHKASTSPA